MTLSVNNMHPNINTNINKNNVNFTGRNWGQEYKVLKKALKAANTDVSKLEIIQKLEKLSADAKNTVTQRVKNSRFETKVDQAIEGFFYGVTKFANKLTNRLTKKIDKGEAIDITKKVTSIVLVGNTAKEIVGTALYTVQAMTNEDLPEEKRKFVGMYDLFVGIVSSAISLIFGVGLQKPINEGYNKLFKPLKPMKSVPIGVIATALAGFTSFALQTIVGKRIIAPAVATPFAGKVKKSMMAKEEAKKNNALTNDKKNVVVNQKNNIAADKNTAMFYPDFIINK